MSRRGLQASCNDGRKGRGGDQFGRVRSLPRGENGLPEGKER